MEAALRGQFLNPDVRARIGELNHLAVEGRSGHGR